MWRRGDFARKIRAELAAAVEKSGWPGPQTKGVFKLEAVRVPLPQTSLYRPMILRCTHRVCRIFGVCDSAAVQVQTGITGSRGNGFPVMRTAADGRLAVGENDIVRMGKMPSQNPRPHFDTTKETTND